jgi:hypothetical protein
MKKLIAMTDEARAAVHHAGPTDKQLLAALLLNEEISIPSSRHIRWMAAEILKQRKWKITYGWVGGKRSVLPNAILLSPGTKIQKQHSMEGVATAREAIGQSERKVNEL